MSRIAIIQGKSDGAVTIKLSATVRICDETLEGFASKGATPGDALHLGRLERAILLLGELPGVQARSMISRGSVPGSAAVTFDVSEGPIASGIAWSDNTANRYAGAWGGNVLARLNDACCGSWLCRQASDGSSEVERFA